MLNTGRSLAELPVEMMLAATYYVMIDTASHLTEEVQKARESFKRLFRNARFESETGLPAVALSMGIAPADAKDFPGDPLPLPPQD